MIQSLRARLFIGLTSIVILTGAIGATLAYQWAYDEAIEAMQLEVRALQRRLGITTRLSRSRIPS